jgi:outer membrane protein
MKRLIAILLALSLLTAFPVGAAEVKLGYVDLQKALNLSESGKAAKEKIQKKVKEHEGAIDARQKDLKKLKDELEKQSLLLSVVARGGKVRDVQQ